MSNDQTSFADVVSMFHAECEDFIDITRAGATALITGKADPDTLILMQRAVHSAKGGAGALGYLGLHYFAGALEDVLDALRTGEIGISLDVTTVIATSVELLAAHIATATDQAPLPNDADMLIAIRTLLNRPEPDSAQDEFGFVAMPVDLIDLDEDAHAPWRVSFSPSAADLTRGREPLLLLRELAFLGGDILDPDLTALPDLDRLDPRDGYIGWTVHMPADVPRAVIEECLDFVSPQACLLIERMAPIHTAQIATAGLPD
jgi:two-component system chemotaxis sensor kinase CheA